MTKSNQFKFDQSDFRGGINYNVEEAAPNQLFDARDVWAPYGALQSRPGLEPVSVLNRSSTVIADLSCWYYDASLDTYVDIETTVPTAPGSVDDIIYFGITSAGFADSASTRFVWTLTNTIPNTNSTQMTFEYWNGTAWTPLRVHARTNDQYFSPNNYYETATSLGSLPTDNTTATWTIMAFDLVYPEDAALSVVNTGDTRYYFRCKLSDTSANFTLNSGGATASSCACYIVSLADQVSYFNTMKAIDWQDGSTSYTYAYRTSTTQAVHLAQNLTDAFKAVQNGANALYQTSLLESFNSLAVIPPFNTAILAIDWQAFELKQANAGINQTSALAAVEDRAVFNGPGTDFDKAYIAQEDSWPRMKYYVWHENTLFGFNDWENNSAFRWSAFSDFAHVGYRIWPKVSQDSIVSADNSPITGACVFGEQLLTFKQNTLWRIVNEGVDANGLNIYTPAQVFQGVGTLANDSVQVTPVGPLYAANDGVYVFDGVKSAKVSRQIDKFWQEQVDFTKPELFKSGHWKREHLYLLTVPTYSANSDYGNITLVYDYVNNAWWVWELGNIVEWFCSSNASKDPSIYFFDPYGNAWTLNTSNNNYRLRSAWAQTHRFGYKENVSKDFTHFYVTGENSFDEAQLEVISADRESPDALELDFSDELEVPTDEFQFSYDKPRLTNRARQVTLKTQYSGEWVQLKITQTADFHQPLLISQLSVAGVYRGNV